MKKMIIKPDSWQCTFEECPAGFFVFDGSLHLKTEYTVKNERNGKYYNDAYCDGGENFWGGVDTPEERDKLIVQPVIVGWEEYDA